MVNFVSVCMCIKHVHNVVQAKRCLMLLKRDWLVVAAVSARF